MCWCPHHTILPESEYVSTWLNYSQLIFDWFEKHKDVVLLWRSHQLLFGALVNNGFMTQKQLEKIERFETYAHLDLKKGFRCFSATTNVTNSCIELVAKSILFTVE